MSRYFTFLKVYKNENLWFAKTTHWIVNSQTNGPNGSTYTYFFLLFSLIIHIISPLFSNTWNGFNKYLHAYSMARINCWPTMDNCIPTTLTFSNYLYRQFPRQVITQSILQTSVLPLHWYEQSFIYETTVFRMWRGIQKYPLESKI